MKTMTKPRKPFIRIDKDAAQGLIVVAVALCMITFAVFGIHSCHVSQNQDFNAHDIMHANREFSIEIHQPKYIEIVYAYQSYTNENSGKEYHIPEKRYLIDVTRLTRIDYSRDNTSLNVIYYRDEDRDWTLNESFPGLSFGEWNDSVIQLEATPSVKAGEILP